MTLQQNSVSNSLQQFQKLWERISSLNKDIAMVNKELETIKISINEIDLSELECSLKQYTNEAIDAIPQPDLSNYLTRSHVYNMPQVQPIPGEEQNPNGNGNLLVIKSNFQPNLGNYLIINDVFVQPQSSEYCSRSS
jgi:hypothetical protein